jgi:hypothetical protein
MQTCGAHMILQTCKLNSKLPSMVPEISELWLVAIDIKCGGIADLKAIEVASTSDGISSHMWENDPVPHV